MNLFNRSNLLLLNNYYYKYSYRFYCNNNKKYNFSSKSGIIGGVNSNHANYSKGLSDTDQMILHDSEKLKNNSNKAEFERIEKEKRKQIIINSLKEKHINIDSLNNRNDKTLKQYLLNSNNNNTNSLNNDEYQLLSQLLSKHNRLEELVYLLFRYNLDNGKDVTINSSRYDTYKLLLTSINNYCDNISHSNSHNLEIQTLAIETIGSILRILKMDHYQVDIDIYHILLEIYVKFGRKQLILDTLDDMKLSVVNPTFDTYMIVASVLDKDQLHQLMQSIKNQSSTSSKPSMNSYQLLNQSFEKFLNSIDDNDDLKK